QDGRPDWSPDGSKIAFDSDLNGEFEIYVMNSDGSGLLQITTLTNCFSPQWSPDGTRIAFFTVQNSDNIIYTVKPNGSDLLQVTDPSIFSIDPYWSPDGLKIAFTGPVAPAGIYTVNANGSDLALLLAVNGLAYFAWSPDSVRLVLSKVTPPDLNFDLFSYNINSGVTNRLTDSLVNHNSVDWSPEGHYLIFHSWMGDFPVNWEIYTITSDGKNLKNLTNNPAADAEPDWTK
ncbi:MAG: hypothetical protein WAV05_15865, partial [Anaerolineales bacterium]